MSDDRIRSCDCVALHTVVVVVFYPSLFSYSPLLVVSLPSPHSLSFFPSPASAKSTLSQRKVTVAAAVATSNTTHRDSSRGKEQGRAGQSRAEQGRAGQSRAEQGRAGQSRAGKSGVPPDSLAPGVPWAESLPRDPASPSLPPSLPPVPTTTRAN